jgi:hypothetical protein
MSRLFLVELEEGCNPTAETEPRLGKTGDRRATYLGLGPACNCEKRGVAK